MRWFLPVLVALLLVAPPAHAFTAISSAIVGWLGGAAAIGSVGVALVQVGVGLVGSALARALSPKPKAPERAGIRTEVTTEGDVTPQTIMLGRYATAGNLVAPYYSFDSDRIASGDYRVAIYDLGDLPIDALEAILINGTRLALDTHFAAADTTMAVNAPETGAVTANLGRTVKTGVGQDRYAGKVFVRWYDGTQTVADPTLRALFGAHPERPWTSTMIGRGVPYAIVIYKLDDEVWQSEPQARFVVRGAKFLDPRTAATGWTENPMVMVRAILSGVAMPDGQSYGMGVTDADLPADWWDPAMNACDADANGRRYIAGYEARVANPDVGGDEPLSVVDELLKAAGAEICDMGGTWITRVGGPGLPVASLTDDDILRDKGQNFEPFPGLSDTYNAVTATFPSPAAGWNPKQSPIRVDTAAEAEDGERLIADVQLPAVPSAPQVQWLLQDWLRDARRMRRHTISLPPDYSELTPLDAVSWTSARNGYTDKVFSVEEMALDPRTLCVTLALREQDPADYTRQDGTILPEVDPSTVVVQPQARTVPGFDASETTVMDGAGAARRPAIQVVWSSVQPGVRGVRVAVRVQATGQQVATGLYAVADGVAVVSTGIVPGVTYEVRARPVLNAPSAWTTWKVVTTPDVRLSRADVDTDMQDLIDTAIRGAVQTADFAAGIRPVEIVSSLPTTGLTAGRVVYLATDGKLYRYNGGWKADVAATDVVGQLTAGQIAAGAIGTTQLAARAATVEKLAIRDFTNLVQDPGFEDGALGWTLNAGFSVGTSASFARTGSKHINRTASDNSSAASRSPLMFDVAPGDVFYIEAYVRPEAAFAASSVGVRIAWRDAAGTTLSYSSVVLTSWTVGQYQLVGGKVTAPAGAAYGNFEVVASSQTGGTVRWDDCRCHRANAGKLVVDGGITAQHLDTVSMGVAGLAVFGGTLESDNFSEGAAGEISGWQITQTGGVKLGGVVISRNLRIDGGNPDITPRPTMTKTSAIEELFFIWVQSTVSLLDWDSYLKTYIATAEPVYWAVGADQADIDANDVFWATKAEVYPLNRPNLPDRIWVRIGVWGKNVTSITDDGSGVGPLIRWNLYQVT